MDYQLPQQPLNHPASQAQTSKPAHAQQPPTPASPSQAVYQPSAGQTITTPVQPSSSPYITQKEIKKFGPKAIFKLIYIFVFIGAAISGAVFLGKKMLIQPAASTGEILLQARYQPVLWKDFGEVFEPILPIEVYYPSEGWKKVKFLLDSGALVSSLPREEAKKMGLSLSQLPRSTFGGFGGTTSFAYKSEVKIKLSDQEVIVPAVFTEAAGTKAILGRSGFFERYNVYFNADTERIEIRQ